VNIENAKTNLDFALSYAKISWQVFPVHSIKDGKCSCGNPECKNPGKHPYTEHGHNDATTNESQITKWLTEVPDANIGVRTGKVSGIVVLDIDCDKGGFISIEEFDMPSTIYSQTGGGGQHKIYQYDEKIPTMTGFRSGVDFRSDGAYFIAPPSSHISGNSYVWCDEFLEPAPPPDWMKIKNKDKIAEPIPEIIPEGQRNATLTSLAGSMRRRGASPEAIEKALLEENKRCAPPLNEKEILTIAKSISRYEPQKEATEIIKSVLLPEGQIDKIKNDIQAIPKDSDPLTLPALLDPILKEIAKFNTTQGDALIKHTIKEHFGFTNDDLKSYEKALKDYRKGLKDDEGGKFLSKVELIEKLQDERENKVIHPAQDYCGEIMSFAVKVKDIACLITSDRHLVCLEDAASIGFNIKHNTVDTARFSAKGITTFLEGNYQVRIPELFQKICGYVKRFVVFPDEAYVSYVALWIMGTCVFMIFRYYPYVWLNAEKQSGKTLLMEILSAITFNGDLIVNPTEAVIFRDISNNLICMFIDEVEELRRTDKDTYRAIISILNAEFSKAGVVKRVESNGDGRFTVKAHSCYSGKMFAGINEIDDVLQDRTVKIPLLRKKDEETVHRYKEASDILELQKSIRDDLYIFALTYAKDIAELYHKEGLDGVEGVSHLNNRELDIWEPIFLLANLVDAQSGSMDLTGMMETLSKKSFDEKQSDNLAQNETYKILTVLKAMLEDISPLSEDGDIQVFEAARVFDYFKNTEEFEWIEKTNVLTRRFKKIKVKSDQKRIGGEKKRVYILNIKEFNDLCERFKI